MNKGRPEQNAKCQFRAGRAAREDKVEGPETPGLGEGEREVRGKRGLVVLDFSSLQDARAPDGQALKPMAGGHELRAGTTPWVLLTH